MSLIEGGCACGAVRYKGEGVPGFSYLCQCRACQRSTGTGHEAGFTFPKQDFQTSGETTSWTRTAASGNTVTKHRCAICGSPLYSMPSASPHFLMIMAASLDDPSIFKPAKLIYAEYAQPWDCVDPNYLAKE